MLNRNCNNEIVLCLNFPEKSRFQNRFAINIQLNIELNIELLLNRGHLEIKQPVPLIHVNVNTFIGWRREDGAKRKCK